MKSYIPNNRVKKKRGQKVIASVLTGQTGMLKKSVGAKVGINRKNGTVYAYAGPRRKNDGFIGEAYSTWKHSLVDVIPAKYSHLVDRGFLLRIAGRIVKKVPGKHFITRSYDAISPEILPFTRQVLQEALDKQIAKKASKRAKK